MKVFIKGLKISEDKSHIIREGILRDDQLILFSEAEEVLNCKRGKRRISGMVFEGACDVGVRGHVEGLERVGLEHKIE
jgi:hypothetical protein